MCSPVLAVTAVSAVASYMSQQSQAEAQEAALKNQADAQASSAKLQKEQVNEQAADEMSARAKQAQAAEARLKVAAGESGVSGVSEDRNEAEVQFNASQDIATIENNRQAKMKQINAGIDASNAKGESAAASIREPSMLGSGLQIAGTWAKQKAAEEAPAPRYYVLSSKAE